jgi:ribosome maturation factor RimP
MTRQTTFRVVFQGQIVRDQELTQLIDTSFGSILLPSFASIYPFPYNSRLARSTGSRPVGSRPLFLLEENHSEVQAMGEKPIAERVRELAEQVTIDHGLELVHAEVAGPENKPIVRVFIDKPHGVTHEDCSEVSIHLGTMLDVEDFIHASYTLEVSSPGLERGLYKRSDYERFAGRRAKIKSRQPIAGQRNFRGTILGVDGDDVLFDDRTSGEVRLALAWITKANLELDVNEEFRRAGGQH